MYSFSCYTLAATYNTGILSVGTEFRKNYFGEKTVGTACLYSVLYICKSPLSYTLKQPNYELIFKNEGPFFRVFKKVVSKCQRLSKECKLPF